MSPGPMSPISKTSAPVRTASQDSNDSIRKRVCKACDRCRLKKSKCDGSSPCSRCRADNAICVFGERKKSHDKVYPKGYVEMLEQQQGQLVTALQETYHRLLTAKAWTGPVLSEANGYPLTHDILKALNLLEPKQDGSGELETFEEDFSKIQSKLLSEGASYTQRRGSFGSDSDNSQHASHKHSSTSSAADIKYPRFRDSFTFHSDNNGFNSNTSSPLAQSPVPGMRTTSSHASSRPTSFQQPLPLTSDPQFYQAEWTIPDMSSSRSDNHNTMMRPKSDMPAPDMQSTYSDLQGFMTANDNISGLQSSNYDADPTNVPLNGYSQAFSTAYPNSMTDFNSLLDPMEVEFSKFVSVAT